MKLVQGSRQQRIVVIFSGDQITYKMLIQINPVLNTIHKVDGIRAHNLGEYKSYHDSQTSDGLIPHAYELLIRRKHSELAGLLKSYYMLT